MFMSSPSRGGGWGGWSSSLTVTCSDANLVCKETNGVYKLFKKSGISCKNGNLGKTCEPISGDVVEDDSTPTENEENENPTTENEDSENPTTENEATPTMEDKIEACTFPDLKVAYSDTANSWALPYINDLSSKGIMNGNTSGLLNPVWVFEPWRDTTRSEFLKIALRAYCYEYINEDPSSLTFTDVDKASWQARVIKKAVDLGIISTANAQFNPNQMISRAEAIKVLLKVAETRDSIYTVDSSVTTSSFGDLTATWQAKYVEKAKALGIIANNPNFEPNECITRDETSKVVFKSRALHY